MAINEPIAIKSKAGIFNITLNQEIRTSNPSPSNDPWFDVPENLNSVSQGMIEAKQGLGISLDDFKCELGL